MSETMKLYITSHQTGELLGERESIKDVKQPERYVIPPYQTPKCVPDDTIEENEYWAYLDDDGQPVRDYNHGSWVKKEKQVKVIAYHKKTQQTKEFDDKSLVTGEYTIKEPSSRFDQFVGDAWILNNDLKFTTEEHEWVSSELTWYDSNIVYAHRGDIKRSGGHTKEQLDKYAIALCDYTSRDDSGIITVTGDARPSI